MPITALLTTLELLIPADTPNTTMICTKPRPAMDMIVNSSNRPSPNMRSKASRSTPPPKYCMSPNIASITSPGMNRTERKTRMLNTNNVGMVSSNLLMM